MKVSENSSSHVTVEVNLPSVEGEGAGKCNRRRRRQVQRNPFNAECKSSKIDPTKETANNNS
jgi:hypothetical protein